MITVSTDRGPWELDIDRLAPKLYIGSAPQFIGSLLKPLGFDTLVLCAREYQPKDSEFPGLVVVRCPFDDVPELDADTEELVRLAARRVAGEVLRGRRTLVTCAAGRNRSGLVCARTLMKLSGAPAHLVVDHVQRLRANALTNGVFVRSLHGYAASRAVL